MGPKDEIEKALAALREAIRIHGSDVVANRPKVDEIVAMVRRIDWAIRELHAFVDELRQRPE